MPEKRLVRLIQHRYDTPEGWTAKNPVLLIAEMGMETITNKLKMGDGTTPWNSLPYFSSGSNGSGGGDDIDGGSFQSNASDPDVMDGGAF